MSKLWILITNIAAVCAIFGISLANLVENKHLAWASFAIVLMCLVFITWRIHQALKAFVNRVYPNGYAPIATYATYSTTDGERYKHELFRHIQIKTPWKSRITHSFFWTGSKDPTIKTDSHTCTPIRRITNENGQELREIDIQFSKTRLFNEPEMVHIAMDLDDSDGTSLPFLAQKVDAPIQILHFRVELKHAAPSYNTSQATLKRKPLDQLLADFDGELARIPFDPISKSYSHHMIAPEPGFEYRLCWDKPASKRKPNSKKQSRQ